MTDSPSIPAATFMVLGGLALFLQGMRMMTAGLRDAAGTRIRKILSKATRNRIAGYGLGAGLGLGMHSSASSVMTVGFVNAGILTLAGALPILYGLNLGTTLAMQLVSFRFTDLAYAFLFLGFATQLVVNRGMVHQAGKALMGFGMLFLGMAIMGNVLGTFREELAPHLLAIDGGTFRGMLIGILIATLVTGILQSSGAVIGMAFVMLESGMMTSLQQAYPIILGAHIGTSATALLGCIGTGIEAKRTAVANLFFNLFNVLLGVLLAPFFLRAVELSSSDLVHQAANAHTLVMGVAGLSLLPLVTFHERLVRRATPSREPMPTSSFLDPSLLSQPESALNAGVAELNRCLEICQNSLQTICRLQKEDDPKAFRRIALQEEVLNEIKGATRDYLADMTRRYLSRRQALMIQYLVRINTNIERIGDHIESIATLTRKRLHKDHVRLNDEAVDSLQILIRQADEVLSVLIEAMQPGWKTYDKSAKTVLEKRDRFMSEAETAMKRFNQRVADHQEEPLAGLYYTETLLALVRMVRHCKVIAQQMQQPYFGIKPKKLGREEPKSEEKKRDREVGLDEVTLDDKDDST